MTNATQRTDAVAERQGNSTPETTAVVHYQPHAPVHSAGNLKTLLAKQKDSIAQALPRHVTPDRLIKTMLVAANRVPDLLKCTQASIFETINRAAELGLDLSGTLGEAYPVPFRNKITIEGRDQWVHQCTLIIGYRGLAKLARQSGEIRRIESEVVRENDHFQFEQGTEFKLTFQKCLTADRGEPIGAYALVEFKDGGFQADFMAIDEIESIRKRSKSGSDKQGNPAGPWRTDWTEMAKKTVFRRLAKWMPLSTEKFNAAVEQDNADFDLSSQVVSVQRSIDEHPEIDDGSRSDALAKRLHSSSPEDRQSDDAPAETSDDNEQTSDAAEPQAGDAGDARSADGETASEPPRWEQIVIAQSEVHDMGFDDALERLDGFARRVFKAGVKDLSDEQLDDLKARVTKGEIKPKPAG